VAGLERSALGFHRAFDVALALRLEAEHRRRGSRDEVKLDAVRRYGAPSPRAFVPQSAVARGRHAAWILGQAARRATKRRTSRGDRLETSTGLPELQGLQGLHV